MNISNIRSNNLNNDICNKNNGFPKESQVFEQLGYPNNAFDPFSMVYGPQRSKEDINNDMTNVFDSITYLQPLIQGFYTIFFEKPKDKSITKEELSDIIDEMLGENNKCSNVWKKTCCELMMEVYHCSNELKLLISKDKEILLENSKDKNSNLREVFTDKVNVMEKKIQELLIFFSSLEYIEYNINIYYECMLIYISYIKNIDLLWEVYDIDSIYISGSKKNEVRDISSFRERLHLFISSFIKDVGRTSNRTANHPIWNEMKKILTFDLILYPQRLEVYSNLNIDIDATTRLKEINLPEYRENLIYRIDARYFKDNNEQVNDNVLKEYITGCYGIPFLNKDSTKLSFILSTKSPKNITVRCYGMLGSSMKNIKIKIIDNKNNSQEDLIEPLKSQFANYLPSHNGLDSDKVGYTHTKRMSLTNDKNIIEITMIGGEMKYFLYFIEFLISNKQQQPQQ